MIRQNWNIDNSERLRILNLHESATKKLYLGEQTKVQTVFPKQKLGNNFEFGKYESEIVKQMIENLKPQIEDFIKKNQSKQFNVNISAGESQVTNPKGFETKGSLALARANSVKKYFEEIFTDLIKNGTLTINAPTEVTQVSIGKTPYDSKRGDNKNPELIKKYKAEQFVDFDIQGKGENTKSICEFSFDGGGNQGTPEKNYITAKEPLSGKGTLTLDTGSIPDRLVIINNKNQITQDTGYIATRPHKYTAFKYVPTYVSQLTKLNGTIPVSGNKLALFTVKSDFNELMDVLLVDPSVKPTGGQLIRMGQEVSEGIQELRSMFKKGIRTFVLYNISDSSVVPFDTATGDNTLIVYSPLGNTGYTIKGSC